MCFFFCHYITFYGFLSHTRLHYVSLPTWYKVTEVRDGLSVAAQCSMSEEWPSEIVCETSGKGEVLERWEKPILAEAHYTEARYFNNFLLQDFHTKSHKSFHFQFQSVLQFCTAAGGLTRKDDAVDKFSGIYSVPALSLHCVSEHQRGSGLG